MQVLEVIWMLNEVILANQMVNMNFWYIEHYGLMTICPYCEKVEDIEQ